MPVGFRYIRNTCYLISILQCLIILYVSTGIYFLQLSQIPDLDSEKKLGVFCQKQIEIYKISKKKMGTWLLGLIGANSLIALTLLFLFIIRTSVLVGKHCNHLNWMGRST